MNSTKVTLLTLIFLGFSYLTSAQNQAELNEKAVELYHLADKELNVVYQQILEAYSNDEAFMSALKESQRNWIVFRDSELKMKYPQNVPGYYGSSFTMCSTYYLQELTLARIATLKKWLEGEDEGDLCSGSIGSKIDN